VDGIYQLAGDDLKIHISLAGSGGKLPKDFEPTKQSELLVMKHGKK
jgi:hypothetical protein